MKFLHLYIHLALLLLISSQELCAQQGNAYGNSSGSLSGRISRKQEGGNQPVYGAQLYLQQSPYKALTDSAGHYHIAAIKKGRYVLVVFAPGLRSLSREIEIGSGNTRADFVLDSMEAVLGEVTINAASSYSFGIARLNAVEGTAIYEAKKTEVIRLGDVTANTAANNSRQIFAKVAGVHVWESDGGGVQLGVSTRGLNPNRTSEFNTRQNGYDMSADALGYPEAYYTPPAEALEKIEVVRGAASLQYGTQFGGLINFVLKKGGPKPLSVEARQTAGSFGFFSSFNSIGGTLSTKNKGKINYYSFYQYKRGDGWRQHSGFEVHTAYTGISYLPNEKLSLFFDYTFMNYLARQPGGLLDEDFKRNPRQSFRKRNWFRLNWNMASLHLDYKLGSRTRLNLRSFGLIAGREALGSLEPVSRDYTKAEDPVRGEDLSRRQLLLDRYHNIGSEIRLLHNYRLFNMPSVLLIGGRYYRGSTDRMQGEADNGSGPVFRYLNRERLESDHNFPSHNSSLFAENIFNISSRFSITPGMRMESIRTVANGMYYNKDSARFDRDNSDSRRSFVLLGLGLSYRPNDHLEIYANYSQNYRAINFNDLRLFNPNIRVDPKLRDENGYNADLGFRGNIRGKLNFDLSLFFMAYNDRIGSVLMADNNSNIYRLRRNIADARIMGIESFVELDLMQLFFGPEALFNFSVFSNMSVLDARYISNDRRFNNKKVEMSVPLLFKGGATFKKNFDEQRQLTAALQYSYTASHFTDASNARVTPTGIEGLIPAYEVIDFSASYRHRFLTLAAGINNLANRMYFTRRAISYPGPGLIPADGRSFYLTLGVKF